MIASGQLFVDRSLLLKGRFPKKWQIELMLHVTWCSTKMRASEPHRKAVTAPANDHVSRPPRSAGSAKERNVKVPKRLLILTMSRSAIRSGAQRALSVSSGADSHPTCACHSPLTVPL